MKRPRFTQEFRQEAVKQAIDRGCSVNHIAKRLGVSAHSLYNWVKADSPNATDQLEVELKEVRRENLRLKAELRGTKEDREILKKAAAYFAKKPDGGMCSFYSTRSITKCYACVVFLVSQKAVTVIG